jgi:sugar phosphate isomerase/epimerase
MARLGLSLITLDPHDSPVAEDIRRAAELGYEGVEFVDFLHHDMDTDAVRTAIEETGVEPLGVQVGRKDLLGDRDEILDRYGTVGVSTLVFHATDENWTERRARETIDLLRHTAVDLDDRGWDLLIHPNHMDIAPIVDWPVARHVPWVAVADRLDRAGVFDGGPVHDWLALNESRCSKGFNILLERYWQQRNMMRDNDVSALEETMLHRYQTLDADLVGFEIDVAFFPIHGYDPVTVLEYLGERVEQVHVKDIRVAERTLGRWPVWRPPDEGDVDIEGVMQTALANDVDWLTFEHDIRAGDDDPIAVVEEGAATVRQALRAEASHDD